MIKWIIALAVMVGLMTATLVAQPAPEALRESYNREILDHIARLKAAVTIAKTLQVSMSLQANVAEQAAVEQDTLAVNKLVKGGETYKDGLEVLARHMEYLTRQIQSMREDAEKRGVALSDEVQVALANDYLISQRDLQQASEASQPDYDRLLATVHRQAD